jgi:diacylglycerol kinase (ATP)
VTDALGLVVNPIAGRGRAGRLTDRVHAALTEGGRRVHIVSEAGPEATADATRELLASGVEAVVGLGGDGLAHLLLQIVAETSVPLGLIPAGTGNDLAVALQIPSDPLAAARVVLAGHTRPIDAVRTGDRWWASVLCAGFDSAINERVNRMRWPRGPRRYDLAILAELAQLHPEPFTVTVDGRSWTGPAVLVAVGNTGQYGGGFRMCPQARVDDGLLDVTLVGPVHRADLVRMLPRVRSGSHLGHPAVTTLRGKEIRLEADGIVAYADGERLAALPVDARCVPGALRVFAPAEADSRIPQPGAPGAVP